MRSDEVMQEIIRNPTRYDVSGIYYLDNDVTTNNYPPTNTRVSIKKTWTLNQLSSALSPPSKASNPATKTSKTQSQSLATPKKTSTWAEEEKLNKKFVTNSEYYEEGHQKSRRGAKWKFIVSETATVLELVKDKFKDIFAKIEPKFNFKGKRKREDAVSKLIFTEIKKVSLHGVIRT